MQNDTTVFQINYPTGYIALNADTFFPCTKEKAKKVFRLVVAHCSQEEQDSILAFLISRATSCVRRTLELDRRLDDIWLKPQERRAIMEDIRRSQREHYRLKQNIEQFIARRGSQ